MRKSYIFWACLITVIAWGNLDQSAATGPRIDLEALLAQRVPILLEFGRGWCKPCKYMKPILKDMAKAYRNRAIVMTVDMDTNKRLVRAFRIRMMPTQVFLMPSGKEFVRNEGTLEREQIAQIFAKMGVAPPVLKGGPRAQIPQPVAPQIPRNRPRANW
ncbi:MAG: thioredoxin family protein [Deltaproteobacteria bacterium]